MKVKAKIEFKDGHAEERIFRNSSEYFRFIYVNAKKIKVAQTDDIKRPEGKR